MSLFAAFKTEPVQPAMLGFSLFVPAFLEEMAGLLARVANLLLLVLHPLRVLRSLGILILLRLLIVSLIILPSRGPAWIRIHIPGLSS
ncbi:uncharacterized protein METZ01_LOCUS369099, partial [marine metagenome]